MKIAFTICSNNYYAQALLLAESFLSHHDDFIFYIGLVDKKVPGIEYERANIQVLEIDSIEQNIYSLAIKYTIVELNTAVKPHYFLHFFSFPNVREVMYLDPDIYVYQSLNDLSAHLETYDILLTPHILVPIPLDDKSPAETDFLNFGLYNLGFLALKKTENTLKMLEWWKERTYRFGYHNLAKGQFVDQLWINLVPLLFKHTCVITDKGYNMGPWNLHERSLEKKADTYYVNGDSLLFFYHFSNFNPVKNFDLHTVLNRYAIKDRSDLLGIYKDYAEKLYLHNFAEFSRMACHYTEWRSEKRLTEQQEVYEKLPAGDKLIRLLKKTVPAGFKKKLLNFAQK